MLVQSVYLFCTKPMSGKFRLGKVLCTPGYLNKCSATDSPKFLQRHANGDWGDICDEDKAVNEEALRTGGRLISEYESYGTKFWIITERNREVTTFLLPEEY